MLVGVIVRALVAACAIGVAAHAQGFAREGDSPRGGEASQAAQPGAAAVPVPYLFPLEGSKRWLRWRGGICEEAYLDRIMADLAAPAVGEVVAGRKLYVWLCLCDLAPRCLEQVNRDRAKIDKAFRWYETADLSSAEVARHCASAALLGERAGVDEAWVQSWCKGDETSVVEAWRAVEWCLFNANSETRRRVMNHLDLSGAKRKRHSRDHIVLRTQREIDHLWLCTLLTAATVARLEGVDVGGRIRSKLLKCLRSVPDASAKLQAARLLSSLGRVEEARREVGAPPVLDSGELREMYAAVLRELSRSGAGTGRSQ